jgi:hypothetical protein
LGPARRRCRQRGGHPFGMSRRRAAAAHQSMPSFFSL